MNRKTTLCIVLIASMALAVCLPSAADTDVPFQQVARQLLEAGGVRGGLVVHLGCGEGRLTAALRAGDGLMVHGLDSSVENVRRARQLVEAQGIYGTVSVDTFDGRHLPYVDGMVNLIVAERPGNVSREEMLRVLVPGGVALIAEAQNAQDSAGDEKSADAASVGKQTLVVEAGGRRWRRLVKPWPAEMDQWTHYLHDATNNAVAQDTLVGPPKHFQWIGSPRWLRHHDHMSGLSAMVSAAGRLFYIIDLGPRWAIEMPPRWTLVARDAFNGVVLWQRPIGKWHEHLWPLKRGPAQLMRRLVASGQTVYVTLGVGEPVSALDGATGRLLRRYKGTEGAEEIILSNGILLVLVNEQGDAYRSLPRDSVEAVRRAGREWTWDELPRRIVALQADTGRTLWTARSPVAPVTLAATDDRVYFHDGDKVVCLSLRDGKRIWASRPLPRWKPMHVLFGPSLVVYQDVVLFAGGEKMDPIRGGNDTMTALSARTGEVLWSAPHPPSGYASAEDLFVIDGLVWCGPTTNRRDSGVMTGRDVHTGRVVRQFPPDDWPHMPHHRCYRAKATSRYLLMSRTGIELVDLEREHWIANHWVRGSCNYGIMPGNGLIYAPPHSCACYLLAKLSAFNALAPARASDKGRSQRDVPGSTKTARLQRGPAYQFAGQLEQTATASDLDWPTYRHDNQRSGSTDAQVPADLKLSWSKQLGGKLSSLVVAGGRVFVAAVDRHTLYALDAKSGRQLWKFTAGGRIDSPPTVWQGRVLFGSADGHVYCLQAADGKLVWRFRGAPVDQRLMAMEQLESVWPIHGSVLVHDGVVWCVAGRTMWLDGGMHLVRLDARTGELLSETILDDRYPGTDETLQKDIKWPNLPVALPDVLSCDGRHVYMRSQPFDLQGRRTEVITPRNYTEQRGETAHLFSPTGLLDDSWWHRSYWLYGRSYISGAGGWNLAAYQAPAGRILAVDDDVVYGFGRPPLRLRGTPNAYQLFACAKEPKLIRPNPKRPPRRQGSAIFGRVVPSWPAYAWAESLPVMVRAIVATGQTLFAAGPPAVLDENDVYVRYGAPEMQKKMAEQVAAFAGRRGGLLVAVSKADGSCQAAYRLGSPPVFDGLVATAGRLYMATLDGQVICLGSSGKALEPARDVQPGPAPSDTTGFVPSVSHPDFDRLENVRVTASDLGYRLQTAPREVGLALKKLARPLTGRVQFDLRLRTTPGAASPDQPGNAFLAFGDAPQDGQLVKCGIRISGKRLYIVQGPLMAGQAKSIPVPVKANQVTELRVVVDLDTAAVTAAIGEHSVEAKLQHPPAAIGWVGCCVAQGVTADFGAVAINLRP